MPVAQDEWERLDTKFLDVEVQAPAQWTRLDFRSVSLAVGTPVGQWVKLDTTKSITLAVGTPAGQWVKLDTTKSVPLAVGAPTGKFTLVKSYDYPAGKTYKGKTEICTVDLMVLPFSWAESIGLNLFESFGSQLAELGGQMLKMEVYADKSIPLWTTLRFILTATKPVPAQAVGNPWIWAAIILAALVVAALVLVLIIFQGVEEGNWGQPASWIFIGGIVLGLGVLGLVGYSMYEKNKIQSGR